MYIRKLNIFGFGKHENLSLEFSKGLNILYGLNEAGKTTIQQFILHILFGFPSKNNQLLRYEPKMGTKYGGQVVLETDSEGVVTIERMKGKASGDVIVYFEDGRRGGEEELRSLLHHYDRHSFESIFSFSLLQLQAFEKMDEMELSRTLLASGTTGVDSLTSIEKKMQKEMDNLFKPTGKKPELNVAFEELRTLEMELKEIRKRTDLYGPTLRRINEIEEELSELTVEENDIRNNQTQLALYRQAAPLLSKQSMIHHELASYEGIHFPSDGIRRMESLLSKIMDTQLAIDQLREEIGAIQHSENQELHLTNLESLGDLLARESEWHQWRTSENELTRQIQRIKKDVDRITAELGIRSMDGLNQVDLSLAQEEKMQSLVKNMQQDEEQIRFILRQVAELDNELKTWDSSYQSNRPSLSREEEEIAAGWPSIQRKLSEAKAYLALTEDKPIGQINPVLWIGLTLALTGIIIGVVAANWLVVMLSLLLLPTAFLLSKRSQKIGPDERIAAMKEIVRKYDGKEEQYDRLYDHWRKSQEEQQRIVQERSRILQRMEALTAERERVEGRLTVTFESLKALAAQSGLEPLPAPSLLPELFKMMRELRSASFGLAEAEQDLNDITIRINRRYSQALILLDEEYVPEDEIYGALRKRYSELMEFKSKNEVIKTALADKSKQLNEKERIMAALLNEQQQLLSEAGSETSEQFYVTYEKHKEKEDRIREASQLKAQLDAIGYDRHSLEIGGEEVERLWEELSNRLTTVISKKEALQEEKVQLQHLNGVLVNDESYGLKLQEFEMKKAQVDALAKRWAVYKSVSEAISRMLRNLKENKLPAVLKQARSIFSQLSEGAYTSLEADGNGLFVAVSKDGIRYSISELSQATKEQAYIALRFALAESLIGSAPFPIIMDDPFVHFDRRRMQRMVELVSEMQQRHQFLYFTCHEEMTKVWEDAAVILVNREKGAISI